LLCPWHSAPVNRKSGTDVSDPERQPSCEAVKVR
jgi:nitrite reductase/ring-hydroxylating ferredoxin subunit